MTDVASLAARLTQRLRGEGMRVDAERTTRFVRALLALSPADQQTVYRCALATLASSPDEVDIIARIFGRQRTRQRSGRLQTADGAGEPAFGLSTPSTANQVRTADDSARPDLAARRRSAASPAEQLSTVDFDQLDDAELAAMADAMRQFRLATPRRRTSRFRPAVNGRRVDGRATLRHARRTAGEPVTLRRRSAHFEPRRLVVLCDISASMAGHARAMLQLLHSAAVGAEAEVFTFATRLTRITPVLVTDPEAAFRLAGRAAPDWSSGTRIGAAVRQFVDGVETRNLARGAVVVIVSDGWDSGDPAVLDTALERLAQLTYRLVWVNPRTARPNYRPLVRGMAAALPHCSAVVSAHNLAALPDLLKALATPHRDRRHFRTARRLKPSSRVLVAGWRQ